MTDGQFDRMMNKLNIIAVFTFLTACATLGIVARMVGVWH